MVVRTSVVGTTDYDAVEFERSQLQQIVTDPPRSAYVKSAEDILTRAVAELSRRGSSLPGEARDRIEPVRDEGSPTGWKLEVGPFPGWERVPSW